MSKEVKLSTEVLLLIIGFAAFFTGLEMLAIGGSMVVSLAILFIILGLIFLIAAGSLYRHKRR